MRSITLTFLLILCLPLSATGEELLVSAAASLTDALSDLEQGFEAANPGADLIFNFASSGALYRQIEQGAPVDVFASANPKWMDKAGEDGFLVPGTRRDFAANSLVLVAPAENPAQVAGLDDLSTHRVQTISLGSPETVPAGQYAKASLQSLGLYEALLPKFVFAEHVRQVLDYVRRGEVDAAFVYMTDAKSGGDDVLVIREMPLQKPVTYPVAVLAPSPHKKLAQTFIDYLGSPQGLKALEARGFKKP